MADTWTPAEVLALAGIISTALVAIAGLGAQVWLASRHRREERKRLRYDELVKTYEDAGRAISAMGWAMTLHSAGMPWDPPKDLGHFTAILQMHGASLQTAAALDKVIAAGRVITKKIDGGARPDREDRRRVSQQVSLFYAEANRHLREIWPRDDRREEERARLWQPEPPQDTDPYPG